MVECFALIQHRMNHPGFEPALSQASCCQRKVAALAALPACSLIADSSMPACCNRLRILCQTFEWTLFLTFLSEHFKYGTMMVSMSSSSWASHFSGNPFGDPEGFFKAWNATTSVPPPLDATTSVPPPLEVMGWLGTPPIYSLRLGLSVRSRG